MMKTNLQLSPKKVQESNISLRLSSLKILSFSVNNDSKLKSIKNIIFSLGVKMKIDSNNNRVEVVVIVKVFSEKTKKTEIGEVITSNTFEVKNLKRHIKDSNENFNTIPFNLASSIVGISVSNTRGILITKAAGTILSDAIIPIINPSELIKNINTHSNN